MMRLQIEQPFLFGRNFLASFVDGPIQIGSTPQSSLGFGSPNVFQSRFIVQKGLPGPVLTDGAKQAMLNPIPFRSAGRVVSDDNRQAGFISELLQFPLPQPTPIPIGPAAVRLDQQLRLARVDCVAFLLPPSANDIEDRKST